jgi:hypothetical protein
VSSIEKRNFEDFEVVSPIDLFWSFVFVGIFRFRCLAIGGGGSL